LLLALAGADPWAGIKTGIRYFVGAPGALLAGLGLFAQARQRRREPGDASLAAFLLIGALAFIGYGLLTLVLGRADPQLPQWLPLQADFAAVFGFPVQLARALFAVAIAFALTKVVRIANAQMQGRLATALEQAARSNAELERRVAERTQAADAVNLQLRVEVAERRQAEEALRRLNEELEQRVRERTAKLEAANQELETFTYSVSHDLKAPLRGIDGYSQLLLEGHSDRLDEEGRRFLQNVRQAAQHMGQLINDLLAYARLEKGGVRSGQLDPRELVDALLAERAGEITARGVAVSVAVSGTAVRADRDALAMALRNLLENALKFSRDAAPAQIEIAGQAADGAYVLSVRDNGTGFDMKYHDRIFSIFQRLHRSEEYPGTGIGLAIVKKAMQRMGGRVWAESAPRRGATFYLEIPQ
jgi:signal transduction histidine kinase